MLAKKRRELDAAEAAWLKDVGEYDRAGDYTVDNFQSAAVALRHACNIDSGVAHRYVSLARKLEKLPEVSDVFEAGEISARHAQVVADAYTPARADEIANVEAQLVELARNIHRSRSPGSCAGSPTPSTVTAASVDEIEYDRARALYAATTYNGAFDLRGNGDQLSGDCITTALETEMKRDLQKQDPRSTPKRRFDALTAICRLYLEQLNTSEVHGIRPHISVVVDLDELPGGSAETAVRVPTEVSRHNYSAAMLELISCDCEISRIIMKGRSEILDVGRATDTATAAQWKALVARDGHCQHPGCNRPPSHCEAHHLRHWALGGPTDLDNLELLLLASSPRTPHPRSESPRPRRESTIPESRVETSRHGVWNDPRTRRACSVTDVSAKREPVPFEVYEPGVYLHGTKANLAVGEMLVSGRESNFEGAA